MTYKTIHTRAGLQAMAAAEVTSTTIQLAKMALCDGDKP